MMLSSIILPPSFVMFAGALLLPLFAKRLQSIVFIIVSAAALVMLWGFPDGLSIKINFLEYTLVLVRADALSKIFGIIFAIITIIGGIYSFHIKETGQKIAALLYAGSALGITFAGDFFTLLVHWEIMAVASTYLIWARRTKEAQSAGMRYLLVHLFGGSMLIAGILLHLNQGGSLLIESFSDRSSISAWLILAGVCLNAAVPPLHAWLVDSYPKATITGAVFLSAFTTKSAVYVLIRIFPGWEILIILGVTMALYGVVFAVLANDIREILAYHIISQVGYMVAGVGIGTELALNGTTAHAFSHILYKALLFMGAGAVLESTGKSKLTELGGLARKIPLVLVLYMIGAFSISGFPLFNGFISKSMVVSAAGQAHYNTAMLLLLLASIGTFLSIGLKLPYFTWFSKDANLTPNPIPRSMFAAMALTAFLCLLFGMFPKLLYGYLPYPVEYVPYTIPHLVETTQILIFTFIGFWIFKNQLAGEPTITLDTDWFYRKPARFLRRNVIELVAGLFNRIDSEALSVTKKMSRFSKNPSLGFKLLMNKTHSHIVEDAYNPDAMRPKIQLMIGLVLFAFILLAMFSLFFITK